MAVMWHLLHFVSLDAKKPINLQERVLPAFLLNKKICGIIRRL